MASPPKKGERDVEAICGCFLAVSFRSVGSLISLSLREEGNGKEYLQQNFLPTSTLRLEMTAHTSTSWTVHSTDWWEGGLNGLAKGWR